MLELTLPLVLASQSPRRRDLLHRLGLEFEVQPSDVDESFPEDVESGEAVEIVAARKAARTALFHPDGLTLAADTVVVLGDEVLGKPVSAAHARDMLQRLSGRTHIVYTGIALAHPTSGRTVTDHEATRVTFGELDSAEISAYVATGSPMDKAGSYGIQDDYGALLVERIEGDYYNVVGLPLRCLYRTIRQHFPDLLRPRQAA